MPVRVVDILILSSFDHTKTDDACSLRRHSHLLFIRPQENGCCLFASSTFSSSLHSTTRRQMMPVRVVDILILSSFDHTKTEEACSLRRHSHPLFIRPHEDKWNPGAFSSCHSSFAFFEGTHEDKWKTDGFSSCHHPWGQRPHTPGKSHEDD